MAKKYIQIITEENIWEQWKSIASKNGMPLVTYIKYLLTKEIDKIEKEKM